MQEFRRSDESSFLDAIIKEATGDWIEEEVNPQEDFTDETNNTVVGDSMPSQEQALDQQRDPEKELYSKLFTRTE